MPRRPRLHRSVRQSGAVPVLSAPAVRRRRQLRPDRHPALHPDRRDHERRRHHAAHCRHGDGLRRLAQGRARLRQHSRQHVHLLDPGIRHRAGRDHGADHGPGDGEEGLRQDLRRGIDRLWRHARPDHSAIGDVRGLQRAGAGLGQRHADRRHRAGRHPHGDVLPRHRADGICLQLSPRGLSDAAPARHDDPADVTHPADSDRHRRHHPQRPRQCDGIRCGRRGRRGTRREILDQGIRVLAAAADDAAQRHLFGDRAVPGGSRGGVLLGADLRQGAAGNRWLDPVRRQGPGQLHADLQRHPADHRHCHRRHSRPDHDGADPSCRSQPTSTTSIPGISASWW
ncbi:hypothetical protein ABIF44_000832 [Bradyrhizobium japonicum]|nr:hypothetical protein [Bradyrhizobium japonicum]